MARLEIADLIDLELQFLEDEQTPDTELHRRDRKIGLKLRGELESGRSIADMDRRELAQRWLHALDPDAGESVGLRVQRALRRMRIALSLLGLLLGWGTASALLVYRGKAPIDINHFLEVFVVVQVLLLVLLLLSLTSKTATRLLPGVGSFQSFLRSLIFQGGRLVTRGLGLLPPEHAAPVRKRLDRLAKFDSWFAPTPARLGYLQSLQQLYGRVERWQLVGLTQAFGVAFNVGAVLCFLNLVLFSNMAFGWSTTVFDGAEPYHAAMSVLAAPWSWLIPSAAPDLELVKATEFFYVKDTFAARESARWWPFLFTCLVVYGLVPRVVLLILSSIQSRKALEELPLDSGPFERLVERLTRSVVELGGARPASAAWRRPTVEPEVRPGSGAAARPSSASGPSARPDSGATARAPSRPAARQESKPEPRPASKASAPAGSEATPSAPATRQPSKPAPESPPKSGAESSSEKSPPESTSSEAASAPAPETPTEPETPAASESTPSEEPAPTGLGVRGCQVVCWEEGWIEDIDAEALIGRARGWELKRFEIAGDGDVDEDAETVRAIADRLDPKDFVLMLVESWVVPSRDLLAFLKLLRESLAPRTQIVVGLLREPSSGQWAPPEPHERECWDEKASELGDPFLRIESVVETAGSEVA